jgi:hypothetical protein
VEAIKLENVRKLRDRILKPMEEYAKPLGFPLTGDAMPDPKVRYTRTRLDGCVWWAFTHTGTGALTLWLVGAMARGWFPGALPWLVAQWQDTGVVGRSVGSVVGAWVVFFVSTMIGEGYHHGVVWLTRRVVDVADFIDSRTPDGTIGLIGFFVVVVGFILQFVGTWLARPR